jgi:hypothetical protein
MSRKMENEYGGKMKKEESLKEFISKYEKPEVSLTELKTEMDLIKKRYPTFKDDSAFVFWFLYAYLVDKEEVAKSSLTGKEGGRGGEKNIDAIYIDEKNNQCNIIQGKFHSSEGFVEKRNDVLTFADLVFKPWESKSILDTFYANLDPIALEKFKEVVNYVKNKKYSINLYYVTTGTCTETIINEAKSKVKQSEGTSDIFIITHERLLRLLRDYLDDIIPHIQPLKLKVVSEGVIQHEGSLHRFDPKTKIESWVVSACGSDISEMYSKVGRRLFAKNIRGWLGDTDINDSIAETIKKEPDNFWYYNNGVTIVCDDAKKEQQGGEDFIIVDGAQVINGQQTTRTLNANEKESKNTNVLVKIIKIPRDVAEIDYDKLINSIVRATNWQNYISPSDLVSNDYIQVFLQKELRKVGYQYIRKKSSRLEARTDLGQGYYQIDKREMAQAVAACLFDPVIVRKGKEGLFEDPYYIKIFDSKNISFYLSKWRLMKEVQYAAKGYPQRAYAKWVVLSFIWNQIGKDINSGYSEKKFRYACERRILKVKSPLNKSIDFIFKSALKFYRLNRGEGEEAKTESDFFQRINLNTEFVKFWESSENPYKRKVNGYINKFKDALDELDIEG